MNKNIFRIGLFCVAAVFLFFCLIDQIPLWSSDEGRFAEIARAMHATGDWVVPYFNGLPYLEKPALAPWMTAFSFSLFGINAASARLPGILSALGCLLVTFLFTRRLFGIRAAALSSLCLMTSAGFVLVGRFAVIDMEMIFLLSTALFFVMTAVFEQKPVHYLYASCFMGLTFLAKGLIGAALPVLVFLAFMAWTNHWKELKRSHFWFGIFIFAAITIPWMLAILKRQPEFLNVFIFEHHFKRFTSGTFGRKRPFWFFTYILPLVSIPWSLFLPAAIKNAFGEAKDFKNKMIFLICWLAVIFIFFSIPRSKLPYYIVPVTVPIAVLVGAFLAKWSLRETIAISQSWIAGSWKIISIVCVIAAAGLNISLLFANHVPALKMLRPLIPVGAVFLGIGGIEAFYFFKKDRRLAAIIALAASIYCALLVVIFCMVRLSPMQSTYDIAAIIKENSAATDIVSVYGSPDRYSDLPFYLGRRIMIVGSDRGTLTRESEQADNAPITTGWFSGLDEIVRQIQTEKTKRVFCLMEKDRLDELKDRGLKDFRVWMDSHGRILISNH